MSPRPVPPELIRLVAQVQLVEWPLWTESAARTRREILELCRLQAARGLTLLSWLAQDGLDGVTPPAIGPAPALPERTTPPPSGFMGRSGGGAVVWEGDLGWLLDSRRLCGGRRERMYAAADRLPIEVRELVVANWTWALGTPHGGQATAAYLAGGAYPDDGYSAARATVALLRLWERRPGYRPAMAAAWAATRTPADWCKAAELRAAYGAAVPIFSYPRVPLPPRTVVRPWIARLLGVQKDQQG
ncbi:hypothetical protein SMC26_17930 [Actinomadura fulvescens]|uniref:hypothetical protein n=1 Tax=Actinomadura fulvescens TaxID=46160 RepID=UPI0031CE31DE